MQKCTVGIRDKGQKHKGISRQERDKEPVNTVR